MKDIILLGGPNGAGKTTAARVLLPDFLDFRAFVNADELARGIGPGNDDLEALAAGRLMIKQMRELVLAGNSFAVETTCAGRSYLRFLQRCKEDGWRIALLFLWLPSPEMALARVARRVSMGGHDIPKNIIERRYYAGIWNMRNLYLPLADEAEIYDNSDSRRILIAEKRDGLSLIVHDLERWAKIGGTAR